MSIRHITLLVEPAEIWVRRTRDIFMIGDKRYSAEDFRRKLMNREIESLDDVEKYRTEWSEYVTIRNIKKVDLFATQLQLYTDAKVTVTEDYLYNAHQSGFILYQANIWPLNREQFEIKLAGCEAGRQLNLVKRLVLLNAEDSIINEYPLAATVSVNDYEFGGATTLSTDKIGRAGSLTGQTDVAKLMDTTYSEGTNTWIVGYSGERLSSLLIRYLQTYRKIHDLED